MTDEEVEKRIAECRKGAGRRKLTSDLFDNTLFTYINTLRSLHFPVHGLTVCESAKRLARIPELQINTNVTKLQFTPSWANKWLKRNNITLRRVTSTKADCIPKDYKLLGYNMVDTIKCLMYNKKIPLKYIINSDETPIFLENNYNYTYDSKSKNDNVGIIQSCQKEKDRVSFLLSINAEGQYLTTYIVVKGKQVNRLVSQEVLSNSVVRSNSKAWLTTDLIIDYIIYIIIPYTCN